MSNDKPLRDWATWVTRAFLLAGIGYMAASWRGVQEDISSLKADVSYIKGIMKGGRGDR